MPQSHTDISVDFSSFINPFWQKSGELQFERRACYFARLAVIIVGGYCLIEYYGYLRRIIVIPNSHYDVHLWLVSLLAYIATVWYLTFRHDQCDKKLNSLSKEALAAFNDWYPKGTEKRRSVYPFLTDFVKRIGGVEKHFVDIYEQLGRESKLGV